jgi:hypothetical protein
MKTRSSSGVGQKVDLAFDPETLKISDCEEGDDEYNPNGGRNRITESIKNRTTISRATTEADPIKEMAKVRADTGSSKLRELLGNLGSVEEDL